MLHTDTTTTDNKLHEENITDPALCDTHAPHPEQSSAPAGVEQTKQLGASREAQEGIENTQAGLIYGEGGPVSWQIEARVLAGQSDEEIAASVSLPVEVVADYIRHFFDFRGYKIGGTQLFLDAVEGRLTPGGELTEGDVWRLVGWLHGPVGLDRIIDDYHGRTDPDNSYAVTYSAMQRATATVRFVNPRCQPYADALRKLRSRYRLRDDRVGKIVVAYCDQLLVAAGWDPEGEGRLTSKARRKMLAHLNNQSTFLA